MLACLEALQKSANNKLKKYMDDSCKAKLLLIWDSLTSFQFQEWRTMVTDHNNRYCNAEKQTDLIAGQKVVIWWFLMAWSCSAGNFTEFSSSPKKTCLVSCSLIATNWLLWKEHLLTNLPKDLRNRKFIYCLSWKVSALCDRLKDWGWNIQGTPENANLCTC